MLATNKVRFGVVDFVLITRLHFIAPPLEADIKKHSASQRIQEHYFNEHVRVNCKTLELPFDRCHVSEEIWKLGLCHFIEDVLFGSDPFVDVDLKLFIYVKDEEFCFKLPEGSWLYKGH